MSRYVNHHVVDAVFVVPESEADPQVRADILADIQTDFVSRMLHQYERTVYELKKQGWNTGQISDFLSFSERRVKRMISDYSKRTGVWNPLQRRTGEGAIDISHLVMRQHNAADGQASPSRPIDGDSDTTTVISE